MRLSGNGGDDTIGTANDSTLADSAGIKAGTTGGSADEGGALPRPRVRRSSAARAATCMKSGSADDKVFTGSHAVIDEFGDGSGDDASPSRRIDRNTVDTGAGSDTVYGSNGLDFVTTALDAGAEGDRLRRRRRRRAHRRPGLRRDLRRPGQRLRRRRAGHGRRARLGHGRARLRARTSGVLPGAGSSPKKLVGGTGSDRIYGSDGASAIFGDTTVDGCPVQSDPVSKQPTETTNAADAADLILGGNGVDVVNAGGGDDWVYAAGAADRVCGNSGDDHLYAGDAADLVYGGSGADQALRRGRRRPGLRQRRRRRRSTAPPAPTGSRATTGADWLDGGSEADVLLGGTSKAGTADGADVLLGDGGADVLVGDNAQTDVRRPARRTRPTSGRPTPRSAATTTSWAATTPTVPTAVSPTTPSYGGNGDDYAEGNPGTDHVSGEAGDDDLIGGSSELATGAFSGSEPGRPDAKDYLYGGAGQDVITGDNAAVTRGGTAHPLMANRPWPHGHARRRPRRRDLRHGHRPAFGGDAHRRR